MWVTNLEASKSGICTIIILLRSRQPSLSSTVVTADTNSTEKAPDSVPLLPSGNHLQEWVKVRGTLQNNCIVHHRLGYKAQMWRLSHFRFRTCGVRVRAVNNDFRFIGNYVDLYTVYDAFLW